MKPGNSCQFAGVRHSVAKNICFVVGVTANSVFRESGGLLGAVISKWLRVRKGR